MPLFAAPVPPLPGAQIELAAEKWRRELIAQEDAAVRRLNGVYAAIAGRQRARIRELTTLLARQERAGLPMTTIAIVRREIAVQLLRALQDELSAAGRVAADIVAAGADEAAVLGIEAAREAMSVVGRTFEPNVLAIQAQVGALRPGTPLEALLRAIGPEAAEAASQAMIRATAEGWGARRLGRELFKTAQAEGLPRARAELIARTELIRSYREGTRQSHLANADVVRAVRWLAAKTPRTCAACLALDGREFPVGYSQQSHPACRCTLVPVTEFDQGPALTGLQYAETLPLQDQERIFGKAGNRLRKAGWVDLQDFAEEGFSPLWGRSYTVQAQSRLLALAKERGLDGGLSIREVKAATYSGQNVLPKAPADLRLPARRVTAEIPRIAPAGPDLSGLRPDTNLRGVETLADFERIARRQSGEDGYESAAAFDLDGRMLFIKDGEDSAVGFSREEIAQVRGRLLSHNHPDNTSFSTADLGFYVANGLAELRAVGERYTHRLTGVPRLSAADMAALRAVFPEGTDDQILLAAGIKQLHDREFRRLLESYRRRVYQGRIDPIEAFERAVDRAARYIAKLTGLKYARYLEKNTPRRFSASAESILSNLLRL
jgi:hypothetical protein